MDKLSYFMRSGRKRSTAAACVSPAEALDARENSAPSLEWASKRTGRGGKGSQKSTTGCSDVPVRALAGMTHRVAVECPDEGYQGRGIGADTCSNDGCHRCFQEDPIRSRRRSGFRTRVGGGYRFVDFRLKFAWQGSLGWCDVVSVALKHAKRCTIRASASFPQTGGRGL